MSTIDQFLYRAFHDSDSRLFLVVNDFLAAVTVVAIVALVLETVAALDPYSQVLRVIELVAVAIFLVEYLARLYSTKPRSRYVFSFFGLVDLLAIVPTLLSLGNWTLLKTARALRLIRFLRILQLAKVSRAGQVDGNPSFSIYSLSVVIYAAILLFSLLATGTLLHTAEPDHSAFSSIPVAMWWSLQVFLGSIPVAPPDTAIGEFLYIVTRFVGLLLLGLLIGILGNLFRIVLQQTKQVTYEE